MKSNKDIIQHCLDAMDNFQQEFLAIEDQNINTVPFEGSWTAAQVSDHILQSVEGVVDMVVHGKVAPTSRDPQAQVEVVDQTFLNFEVKFQSPDFILPSEKPMKREELVQRMDKVRSKLINKVADIDLSLTCTDFELPGTGAMTRYEWLNFFRVHFIRHTRQMKKIRETFMVASVPE